MSDSVALVTVERVARRVQNLVSVSDKLVRHLSTSKGITIEAARREVIASAARRALRLAKDDEKVAVVALSITKGQENRLPQCIKLLRKHRTEIVRVAYNVKSELAISDASLRMLCQFLEHTDGDLEGEAAQMQGLLEEISMRASSYRHEWYLHQRIREMLDEGHLFEAVIERLRIEMDTVEIEDEPETPELRRARQRGYLELE